MANRLAEESSLYLRQHAMNPVDWWPWCQEAFDEARRRDVPVLVSIGYSSCHWCHVMERECFENEYIAGLMNQHFVNIKVDREERPDVDQIYMDAVQMVRQQGGWPLNCFCLPDGRPFYGGTYFPPEEVGHGIVPWPQLLLRISKHYREQRDDFLENADSIIKNIAHNNNSRTSVAGEWSNNLLLAGAKVICGQFDEQHGGFGSAPKFPPSMKLNYLLAVRASAACEIGSSELANKIDKAIPETMKAMARGGLFDQLGGGFYRYSVDNQWQIPHFEKMLYDNGLLLDAYAKGWQRYREPIFRKVVEETIAWLKNEMLAENGGFRSSIDADSEGEEGKYYVWSPKQVTDILGEQDALQFCDAYGISEGGNFEKGTSNPVLSAESILKRDQFSDSRLKLLKARMKRVPPGLDSKQLVSWNALVIRGLAEAGWAFGQKDWMHQAIASGNWIWDKMRESSGRLQSVNYEDSGPSGKGFLDDYAFTIEAFLSIGAYGDWIAPGTSSEYINRANQLMEIVMSEFRDKAMPGFFFISEQHEQLVVRKKEWFDNAIPAGNSSLIHALSCLHALTGNFTYAKELADFRNACSQNAQEFPHGIAHAMTGLTWDAVGIAVIKVKGEKDLTPLQEALTSKPWRKIFIQISNDPDQPDGYQLCVGEQCMEPTKYLEAVLEKL
jgi:uncharacterized protein YyaL (SSP411 family)